MSRVARHTVCRLVRHGQTAWNREGRYLSHTDLPLTPFGWERAQAVGRRLRRQPVTVIVHCGLERTAAGALAIADAREGPALIEVDHRWREADYGRWEGLTYHEMMARYADEAAARFADPWSVAPMDGETIHAMRQRVLEAWTDLLQRHDGGRIVVVTHATPIQILLGTLLGSDAGRYWQIRVDLGSLSWVDLYASAAIMRTVNELPELRGRHPEPRSRGRA